MIEYDECGLSFETFRRIISEKTNRLLDDFIEFIDCTCESYSLINIVRQCDNYEKTKWHDLIVWLNEDLTGYELAMEDEKDLTDMGYDFLILFTQNEILEEHQRIYNLAVFGREK